CGFISFQCLLLGSSLLLPVEPLPACWLAELGVGADGVKCLSTALAYQCIRFTRYDLPLGNLALALLLPQILRVVAGAALPAYFLRCQLLRGGLRQGYVELPNKLEIDFNFLHPLPGAAVRGVDHDFLH